MLRQLLSLQRLRPAVRICGAPFTTSAAIAPAAGSTSAHSGCQATGSHAVGGTGTATAANGSGRSTTPSTVTHTHTEEIVMRDVMSALFASGDTTTTSNDMMA